MNKDSRFAENNAYLFASQQRVEREQLERQCDIFFREGRTEPLTNEVIKVSQDDIQNVFQRIRGTSQYWRVARNEILAKVKQLGPFQYFFTLSCAEMRWQEVFVSILKCRGHRIDFEKTSLHGTDVAVFVDGTPVEMFLASQPKEKATVLRQYVVHVTRIFNRRVQTFMQKIVMSKYEGCLSVSFYTYRVEMQLRGMAHVHGCLWLADEFLQNCTHLSEPEMNAELIDNFITCALPPENDPLRAIVQEVQTHHHTKTCTKKNFHADLVFRGFPQNSR